MTSLTFKDDNKLLTIRNFDSVLPRKFRRLFFQLLEMGGCERKSSNLSGERWNVWHETNFVRTIFGITAIWTPTGASPGASGTTASASTSTVSWIKCLWVRISLCSKYFDAFIFFLYGQGVNFSNIVRTISRLSKQIFTFLMHWVKKVFFTYYESLYLLQIKLAATKAISG